MRVFVIILFWSACGLSAWLINEQNWWILWGTWIVVFSFFYAPALVSNCRWFSPVVLRFQTSKKEVWITIDDGPHPIDTPLILELLAQHQARATFFVIGSRVERNPELVGQILAQGHTIGNHTHTHPSSFFWIATPSQIEKEVLGCVRSLAKIKVNCRTNLFRAPVGMINFFVQPCMKRHGLTVVGWTARGFDSQEKRPCKIVERIWRDVSPGCIILLHEGHHEEETEHRVNPAALDLLLKKLSGAGYVCVIPKDEQLSNRLI